jgi:hypothetical protein
MLQHCLLPLLPLLLPESENGSERMCETGSENERNENEKSEVVCFPLLLLQNSLGVLLRPILEEQKKLEEEEIALVFVEFVFQLGFVLRN